MICRYFVIIYEKAIKGDFFSYYLLLILTEISIKKSLGILEFLDKILEFLTKIPKNSRIPRQNSRIPNKNS